MNRVADFLNDMSTTWDFDTPLAQGIPASKRDFSRPKQPFSAPKLPIDLNYSQDNQTPPEPTDPISKFQKFFMVEITGTMTPQLITNLKAVESQISRAINKSVQGMIYNPATNSLNTSLEDVLEALSLINNKKS